MAERRMVQLAQHPFPAVMRNEGLPVANLLPGTIYVDRLSFLRVLVLVDERVGPDPTDVRKRVTSRRLYGWYFSAVWGRHMRMELHDGQLMKAP